MASTAGRYGLKVYGNTDVHIFVSMFANFTGQTNYSGNFANDPNHIMYEDPPTVSLDNAKQFGCRQPLRSDGVTPYWFVDNTGDTVLEQQTVNDLIDQHANAGVYGLIFLLYPIPSMITSHPAGETPTRNPWSKHLMQLFLYYLSAPNKSRLKFYLMAVSINASYDVNTGNASQEFVNVGTYLNLPDMADQWATWMQDPDYYLDQSGKPYFGLYDATDSWTVGHQTTITNAAIAKGFSGVHYVQQNQNNAQATALGADLGGYNNGIGAPNQQYSYNAQIVKDKSYWSQGTSGADKFLALASCNDGRVSRGVASWYTDQGINTQIEVQLRQNIAFAKMAANSTNPDRNVSIYSGGEICECGPFLPTRQGILMGTYTPSRGPWLDMIRNAVTRLYPSNYSDTYAATDLHTDITRTGAGFNTVSNINNGGGSNPAPLNFEEVYNVTVGDKIRITPSKPCTGIRIYGQIGSDTGCGTANWNTDGGAATLVNQAAAGHAYSQLIYDSGPLALGTHYVEGVVVTGFRIDKMIADVNNPAT